MSRDTDWSDQKSRRSFLKSGALTSGALALGLGATDGVAAQQSESGSGRSEPRKALIRNDQFRPGALFRLISLDTDRNPSVEGVPADTYAVATIEYLNSDEQVHFFPLQDANLNEGELYRFKSNFDLTDSSPDARVITVRYELFPETIGGEDNQLVPGEDLEIVEGGGQALVRIDNFIPGALILVTSDVLSLRPPDEEGVSNVTGDYNSRMVEFLNTGEDFIVFFADDADIEQGAVYVMRDEFTVTDSGGNLVTVSLDRINQDDVPTAYV